MQVAERLASDSVRCTDPERRRGSLSFELRTSSAASDDAETGSRCATSQEAREGNHAHSPTATPTQHEEKLRENTGCRQNLVKIKARKSLEFPTASSWPSWTEPHPAQEPADVPQVHTGDPSPPRL
ncbi:Hypothetical protein SMAX5B_007236 [Scophthalmus maximus]|uniref:Uncharacterized protein n=1 Tax=Scophthalmus maximus TaxID=52904 RepID=A0A2U9CNN9_SCOMX|nr:Hypothetical protein SMAX5B_007236 [Scophthalmus maximus]